ncbi:pyridoxamine 5'-phosphate oxidase family protein [Oceanicola granulosus HTCC2516]|uniref:Pyridoxamine 5'-phosphate oxidase family protein n=1 Tax=Oceanicola granulosus (strain ATCC BAA-861 / DSM 15982 / KCTC 12143 / HTCC2516) TaxID=314256 RepID=Q2CDR6_OCEGH|nr:MSMEG_1061 family FMN-dependent PPOX-type flavoprotein [Oceanicola granulosus]EAR50784.1 pyridoxamine 5'-phosphate oxidase family protein [Oceanicola granulosus HTCC2516]
MTGWITDTAEIDALYGPPKQAALDKVVDRVTPEYRRWIEAARFCILSTVGPEGTDASPRGDDGPVVQLADPHTLLLPDWRGNNRADSLRNIVRDGRASLLFMVPGSDNVVRVNGTGRLTADIAVTGRFEQAGQHPRSVIVLAVAEVYFQCAKALMRSRLWSGDDESAGLPTAGELIRARDAAFDAEAYDAAYPADARERMW